MWVYLGYSLYLMHGSFLRSAVAEKLLFHMRVKKIYQKTHWLEVDSEIKNHPNDDSHGCMIMARNCEPQNMRFSVV